MKLHYLSLSFAVNGNDILTESQDMGYNTLLKHSIWIKEECSHGDQETRIR